MSKLHELLAVESSLRNQMGATTKELMGTFEKKRTHFKEIIKTFKSNTEGVEPVEESKLGLQTTIDKELAWIGEKIGKALDVTYQINEANTIARADVILDGKVFLEKVPSTALLQIEHQLTDLLTFATTIPTLDPALGFEPDPDRGEGIFKARDVVKRRTEKLEEHIVVVPPTDKHPAQVAKQTKDVVVGQVLEQEWSSLITIDRKGKILDRIEELLRAVKAARSRANDQEVDQSKNKIGQKVLNYAFKG